MLDGFDRQTHTGPAVERAIVSTRRHATIGAAWNAAVVATRAPHLLFFDGRYWPLPGVVEYCLSFHAHQPAVENAVLLSVAADVSVRRDPLFAWQASTGRFPDQPSHTGVYAWPHFRTRAVSCKRALMAMAPFDERFAAGEDVQLSSRLTRVTPLKVWYEAIPQAMFLGPLAREAALEREYRDGYFRRLRVHEDGRARMLSDVEDRFAFAERFVIADRRQRQTLTASLQMLEATCQDLDPAFATGDDAERLRLVYQMYETLFADAAARGWLDAERRLAAAGVSAVSAPRSTAPRARSTPSRTRTRAPRRRTG